MRKFTSSRTIWIIVSCLVLSLLIGGIVVLVLKFGGGGGKTKLTDEDIMKLFGAEGFDKDVFDSDLIEKLNSFQEPTHTSSRDGEYRKYVGLKPNDSLRIPAYSISKFVDAAGVRALADKKAAEQAAVPKFPNDHAPIDATAEDRRKMCAYFNSGTAERLNKKYDPIIDKYWGTKRTLTEAKAIAKKEESIVGFIRTNSMDSASVPTYFFTMAGGEIVGATSVDYLMWIKEDMVEEVQSKEKARIFRGPTSFAKGNWAKYDDLLILGQVMLVATGMSDEVAKKWCVDNFASHFERRGDNVVFKSAELASHGNPKWGFGCEMYAEGLMSDGPDGSGYTWVRLDMLPRGRRNFYEEKLAYLKELKKNSSCGSDCNLARILKFIGTISLITLPLTLPLSFAPAAIAAAAGAATIASRALTAFNVGLGVAEGGLLVADLTVTNMMNWKETLAADRFAKFRDPSVISHNFAHILPDWKYYYLWNLGGGNFDGRLLPECCCGEYDDRWEGPETRYGIKKWEEFEAWPKAKYNFSKTILNFTKFTSNTKDEFLRDVKNDDFVKDCSWYSAQAVLGGSNHSCDGVPATCPERKQGDTVGS